MPVTCAQIADLLASGGRAALDDAPEAQAHIGECEACAERLIALEETGDGLDPFSEPPPALTPPPRPPATTPPSDPPTSVRSPVMPPASLPPVEMPPAHAPSSPQLDWLPSLASQPQGGPWRGLARRASMRIRPVHFWLGSLVSALLGALVVLVVVVVATRRPSVPEPAPEPNVELALVGPPEFGEMILPELVPPPREPSIKAKPTSRAAKGKNRGKQEVEIAPLDVPPPPPADRPLAPAEVSAGIKTNLGRLSPCFEAARKRKENIPGKHTLVFDFLILPNGSVKDGALTGPEYLVRTRLGACLTTRLRAWRFPTSGAGTPVRHLQLPITIK